MAVTIKQTEATPDAYADAPSGLSAAAAALSKDMIWARLEAYTAWRWSARGVVWIVEGPGEWVPPLKPATITTIATMLPANTNCQRQIDTVRIMKPPPLVDPQLCRKITQRLRFCALQAISAPYDSEWGPTLRLGISQTLGPREWGFAGIRGRGRGAAASNPRQPG